MTRFIKRFLIWFLFGLLFAVLLDAMITSGLRRTDIRKYSVWNDIFNESINADVIVIGSSRTWCGYNTYILDSALHCNSYNLGIDGHALDYQVLRYNTYRRFNPAPKLLIINVDFLSTLHNTSDSQYEREQFFPYITDKELIDQVAGAKHITEFDRWVPLYRYFGYREDIENGISAFLGKREFEDGGMHKGYRGNDYAWDQGQVLGRDTLITVDIDEREIVLLSEFVNRACDEGIRSVFVKSPVYYPLRKHFSNIAESDSVFVEIARVHDVPVLDYYDSSISRDSSLFYNASHLNKTGAEVFSRLLCSDLKELVFNLRTVSDE